MVVFLTPIEEKDGVFASTSAWALAVAEGAPVDMSARAYQGGAERRGWFDGTVVCVMTRMPDNL